MVVAHVIRHLAVFDQRLGLVTGERVDLFDVNCQPVRAYREAACLGEDLLLELRCIEPFRLGLAGPDHARRIQNGVVQHLIGKEGDGARILMSGLDYERTVLSGGPTGIMLACMDIVVPYLHERTQFGKSIGEFQLMQGKVADMYCDLNASRAYLYTVAKGCDRGEETRKDAAAVILYTAEKATQMALQAIQTLGGNGYINDYPTGRLLRDAKLYEIGAGTSEVRRMLIGRELFNETR